MRRAFRSIILISIFFCASASLAQTSLDALGRRYSDFYTAADADRFDPALRASLDALESDARDVSRAGFLRSDGTWVDINYAEVPGGAWSPWEHFRRMTTMARAYSTPGQGLYRNAQLLVLLEAALNQLPSFYGTSSKNPPGNWWFWVLGPALDLGPTLVLVRNDISPQTLTNATNVFRTRIGSSPFTTPSGSALLGQNLVWSALNHMALAILTNDSTRMSEARRAMSWACLRAPGDGIQVDSSFQQHGPQIYNGGYGAAFAADVARYVLITRDSPHELGTNDLLGFADYVADGVARTLYHNFFDASVVGREVAKPTTTGWNGLAALLQMSTVDTPRQVEISRAAMRMLQTWIGTFPVELAGIASSLQRLRIAPGWPDGHFHFYTSDHTVHRRPDYYASVKMLSSRTRSGERTNGENLLGARQSDGRFYLVTRGDEYFTNQVWPTLDWTRLPGTTVEQRPDAATGSYGAGTRSFVGGTGDGANGVSAMDYAPLGTTLTAKKSWFFFDDSIVFLTAGVRDPGTYRVETIIDQRPLSTPGAPLIVDGTSKPVTAPWTQSMQNVRWMAIDGVGYWFPTPLTVEGRREIRTGSWSLLSSGYDTTEYSNPIATFLVNHGAPVFGANLAYAVVPNVTATSMREWADSAPIAILANNEAVAAVRDVRTNSTGYVFFQPASFSGVGSDTPAVVFVSDNGRQVKLSAADPKQSSGTMKITISEKLKFVASDRPVTVANVGRATVLTIQRSGGVTTNVLLARATRTRPARR